jgi:hypothetical protein
MSTHFEIAPGNEGVKWMRTASGYLYGCEVVQYRKVRIYLVDGSGLAVQSNNFAVVPNDEGALKGQGVEFGPRRLIEFKTFGYGGAFIEALTVTGEEFRDGQEGRPSGPVVANFQVKVSRLSGYKPTLVRLDRPQTALNGLRVKPYHMTFTHHIQPSETAKEILAKVHPTSRHLAISAHGGPGQIQLGQEFSMRNVEEFGVLGPSPVRVIWIGSCSVAGGSKGIEFCTELAKRAFAYVVAAEITTENNTGGQVDLVDYMEQSMIHYFEPSGQQINEQAFARLQTKLGFTILPQ